MSRGLLAALALAAVLLAACTSSGGAAPSSAGSSAPVTVPTPPPTTSVATVTPTPTRTPTSASVTVPNPLQTTSVATVPTAKPTHSGDGCTAAQLRVTSMRGGAFNGVEYAGVLFTNRSTTACTLRGYPTAQLLTRDRPLGKPASDGPGTVRTVRLLPGKAAQAQLSAVSTCQSALSDHVRVTAPGTITTVDVPVQLRGCALTIDPVEAA